jgi:hypothetical protein
LWTSLQLIPTALPVSPLSANQKWEGKKSRGRRRDSEKGTSEGTEVLKIKAPKWGNCHTGLIS